MIRSDITDRIRRQLSQRDGMTPESLEPLAVEYDRECIEVNRRLAECVSLLRQGLRSEAIQRANQKPNLLEASAYLDFAELQEWLDILQLLGLKSPTLLDVDGSEQVREAFYDEQPLEALLKRQRQLAIGKAPLAWRLKVLRAIRRTDNANSVWAEDQEQWEIYRLKQIPRELDRAENVSPDLERCTLLAEELESDEWIVKPETRLIERARQAANRLLEEKQLRELESIVDPFYAAFSDLDVAEGKRYYAEWMRISKAMSSAPAPEIRDKVEPAIEWIASAIKEEQRAEGHRRATVTLTNLLDKPKTTLHELESAYAQVTQYQLGMDDALASRLQKRINTIHRRSRNKLIGLVTAICASVLLIAFTAFSWFRSQQFNAEVTAADERLTQILATADTAIKSDKLQAADASIKEADSFLKELESASPFVASHAKTKTHKVRKDQLAGELTSQRTQLDNLQAALLQEIDSGSMGNDGASLELFKKLADKFGQGDDIKDVVQNYERKRKEVQTQEFGQEIPNFIAQRQAIEARTITTTQDVNSASTALDDLVKAIKSFDFKYSYVDQRTREKLQAEVTACEAAKSRLLKDNDRFKEANDFAQMILNSRDLSEYKAGLQSFTSKHSTSRSAAELKRSAALSSSWDAVTNFETVGQEYTTGFTKLTAEKARSFLDQLNKANSALRINHKSISDSYQTTFDYLGDFVQRSDILDNLILQLQKDILSGAKTIVFTQTNGSKPERGLILDDEYKFRTKAMASLKSGTTSAISILNGPQRDELTKITVRGLYKLQLQPSTIYSQISQRLMEEKSKVQMNWELELLSLMLKVAEAEEVDYRVKLRLMSTLLKAANKGSALCREKIDREFADRLIAAGNMPNEQLFGSQSFNTAMGAETIASLRKFQDRCIQAGDGIAKEAQKLGKISIEFVGAVEKIDGRTPVAWTTKAAQLKQGSVYALAPTAASSAAAQNLVPFGKLSAGKVTEASDGTLPVGTPLFLVTSR